MRLLISISIYIVAISVFTVVGLLFIIFSFILPVKLMYKSSRVLCWTTLKSLCIRIKIIGSPPPPGHHIYMFNHSSFVDVFLFAYLMRGPCTALIATKNYSYPILGSILKRFKGIPIERNNNKSAIKSIEQAQEMLSTGHDVVILPEGTRTTTGNLKRFKKRSKTFIGRIFRSKSKSYVENFRKFLRSKIVWKWKNIEIENFRFFHSSYIFVIWKKSNILQIFDLKNCQLMILT